jgi:aryl-alcohol dehydrogenase-like predicted oxidoreductase
MTMAQMALRWILMDARVTCAVPGAKRPEQVDDTLQAADLPALPEATMEKIRKIYDQRIRPDVQALW